MTEANKCFCDLTMDTKGVPKEGIESPHTQNSQWERKQGPPWLQLVAKATGMRQEFH